MRQQQCDQLLILLIGQHTGRIRSYELSRKEPQTQADPTDKIEQLIKEAKKAKRQIDPSKTQDVEGGGKVAEEEETPQGEAEALKRSLKEEIVTTLKETSKELSRIVGVLTGEKEREPTVTQIVPRYCCYCGRDILPNALYCDRCGASVRGVW